MKYRRADVSGATYIFTLNAARRKDRASVGRVHCLRHSFRQVRANHPFSLDAIVVMPEHSHMLMTLPRDDAGFAIRIMLIKQGVSRQVPKEECINTSGARRGERALSQRR